MKSKHLISAAIALIVSFGLLSFIVKPRQPLLELVTPQQELPTYQAKYPGDRSLADRILKSYEIAFILVRTPYLSNNVSALEAMRQWARSKFQAHPDFLHPASLPGSDDHRDTVFGALGYNVLAIPRYFSQEQVGRLLSAQIARYHATRSFASFNTSYFGIYGRMLMQPRY